MKKLYDMYKKIANEEKVQRHQVKTLALGVLYCMGSKGTDAEERVRKTVQMAKRMGVI